MGRVYDALMRAKSPSPSDNGNSSDFSERRNGGAGDAAANGSNGHDLLWNRAPIFSAPSTAHNSASTAHTANATVGSALPGGSASRAVGATLDAVSPARAVEFVSRDVPAARVEPHLVAITQPRSAVCEQFRALRTRLLQAGERQKMTAFVVTSAGVGEGKTLTALNLAWLLAQTDGLKALIIDADLRQPCAIDYLGIEAPFGLSEVLAGTATLEESIVKLNPSGLHLLPGGEARDDVAELLSGPKFARVLSDARRMFDYIIIDAPPLGIFTDANLLINHADGALLVVRAGKTRFGSVDRLLEQLPRERILGVVLNRAEEQPEDNAYYYQRRYYRADAGVVPDGDEQSINEEDQEMIFIEQEEDAAVS
jgi:capsular exopolysaccharide synthesis family protein